MDIHGGKGIIQGPNNYLSHAWQALPIAITVEGANILTRSLIIFGQGVIRAHPWLLKEMRAAGGAGGSQARREFDSALFSHVGYAISNLVRAGTLGLTAGMATSAPVRGVTAPYYRQLSRMSAAFALVADAVLVTLGGKFKFREMLSGRMADVLIHLYLASASLKHFEDHGRPEQDLPLLRWALDDSLVQIQDGLTGVLQNFPLPLVGGLLQRIIFPWGRSYAPPDDETALAAARVLLTENEARERLIDGMFLSDADDAAGRLANAFQLVLASADAERAIRNALKVTVTVNNYEGLVQRAVEAGVITEEQASIVRLAQEATAKVIAVDDFPRSRIEGYDHPAFRPTLPRENDRAQSAS
jgi:acyl-CoA dehydrogenase